MENSTATAEQPRYLTIQEAAEHFRVSRVTLYRRCQDGTLPHIRIGATGPIRIPANQLDRLYEQGVSDDGSPAGDSFAGTNPAERRGTQAMRGQWNPPARGARASPDPGCGHGVVAFAGSRKPIAKPLKLGPERTRSGVSDRHPSRSG